MAQHHLIAAARGDIWLNDEMLIVRYPEGDCDVINRKMDGFSEHLHHALYDAYQCSDILKDGDEFVLAGKVVFRCSGVHVIHA